MNLEEADQYLVGMAEKNRILNNCCYYEEPHRI